VCGHNNDLHVILPRNYNEPVELGHCQVCLCDRFEEDIDRDKLEVE